MTGDNSYSNNLELSSSGLYWAVAGGIVGGAALIIALGLFYCFCYLKRPNSGERAPLLGQDVNTTSEDHQPDLLADTNTVQENFLGQGSIQAYSSTFAKQDRLAGQAANLASLTHGDQDYVVSENSVFHENSL